MIALLMILSSLFLVFAIWISWEISHKIVHGEYATPTVLTICLLCWGSWWATSLCTLYAILIKVMG